MPRVGQVAQRNRQPNVDQRAEVLERAELVVEAALDHPVALVAHRCPRQPDGGTGQRRRRDIELLRSGPNGRALADAGGRSRRTRHACCASRTDSMSQATDKYYPVDVLRWVTADVLDKGTASARGHHAARRCLLRLLLIDVGEPARSRRPSTTRASPHRDHRGRRPGRRRAAPGVARHDAPFAAYLYALRVSGLIRNEPDPEGSSSR